MILSKLSDSLLSSNYTDDYIDIKNWKLDTRFLVGPVIWNSFHIMLWSQLKEMFEDDE